MMEIASISPTVVSSGQNKLEPIDELTVCVPDTPFLSCHIQAMSSTKGQFPGESPSPRSEKDDNISMLGESREPSEEFFRDSNVSSLTANSRSTSLSSLTLSSNDYARSNQIPQLKFLTHQNSMFLKKNSPKNSPRVDSPRIDTPSDDSPSTLTKSQSVGITGTPPQHPPIAKTLSFRTDSTGSLGSLLSHVEIPMGLPLKAVRASSDDPRRESFDSETGLPRRFNNRNVSSILITALKQSNRQAKKSVSFSIPSEDDIARKASKARGMLYQPRTVDAFDDNIPDYQITSPKNSADGGPKARVFASPTKDTPMVEAKQLIKNHKQEAANSPSGHNSQLPPRPPAHSSNVGMTNHLAHTYPKHPNGHSSHHSKAPNGHISHHGAGKLNGVTQESNNESPAVTEAASAVVLPLMQRVSQATTAAELCEVFSITTESVFLGEVMKKRFSKDLLGKERHVWIEPRTKSIHWAKNAHDRQANVKVKYFLLDKNNPSLYIGTDRPMSSSSTATTATAASVPTSRADANSNSNNSAAENIDTADTTSSNTIEGAPATALLSGAAVLNVGESNTNKAQGQLVGIIHSATINHLSIRIQTESGDYLNLTIHSGKGATQRAKDWFEVIKTLTKDISPVLK